MAVVSHALEASPTFASFQDFMGNTPFTPNEQFWSMMKELDADGIQWVSTLQEHDGNTLCRQRRLFRGSRVLSVGPLEGALEFRLAQLGAARIVALEGYRPNYLKCRVLNALFPEMPLEFVESDATQLDSLDEHFDIVLCWGVLYHLHDPHVWLQKVKALNPCVVLIGTQMAVDPPHPAFAAKDLSDVMSVEVDGRAYRGRRFPERHRETYRSALDERASFWFYPDELRRLATDLGFQVVESSVLNLRAHGLLGRFVLATPPRRDWPASIRAWVRPRGILGLLPRRPQVCRVDLPHMAKLYIRKKLGRHTA